ncbi:hypothetical protein ENUP19_0340G0026 [Entamoeba nuttalli]|uniref:CID domain-containing protein n=2 Tax=Entamoeba nuttalli TaxID=412467 RepID=K2GG66_ENTNP|nr:hypothetical protein ENU1_047150 [Entamoeba nuttalli P19]EKE41691.1 hypothetical protein ENU1_047150 [Entamoeba nuttalli P19]|eukprot:XP_008855959.1 hypothetical protein ENU1_047150 [Entamoeba nuttalli P19]
MNSVNSIPIPNDELTLCQFKKVIESIKNDQGIITSLAQMAVGNVIHADLYVEIIYREYMNSTNSEKRLCLLYVIDMIVKIDINRIYVNLFIPNITSIFIETYNSANETIRIALWQLYLTWTNVFPAQTLNQIRTSLTMISQGYRNSPAFQVRSTQPQQSQPTIIPVSYDSQGIIPISVNTQVEPLQNASFTPVRRYKQPKQYNYNSPLTTPRRTPKKQSKPSSPINVSIDMCDNSSLPPSTDPAYKETLHPITSPSVSTSVPAQIMSPAPTSIPVDVPIQMSPMYSQTNSVITEPVSAIHQTTTPTIRQPQHALGEICPICGGRFVDMERHVQYHQVLSACEGLQTSRPEESWNEPSFIQQEDNYQQPPCKTNSYTSQPLLCSICNKPLVVVQSQNGELLLKDGAIDNLGQFVHQQCLSNSSTTAQEL